MRISSITDAAGDQIPHAVAQADVLGREDGVAALRQRHAFDLDPGEQVAVEPLDRQRRRSGSRRLRGSRSGAASRGTTPSASSRWRRRAGRRRAPARRSRCGASAGIESPCQNAWPMLMWARQRTALGLALHEQPGDRVELIADIEPHRPDRACRSGRRDRRRRGSHRDRAATGLRPTLPASTKATALSLAPNGTRTSPDVSTTLRPPIGWPDSVSGLTS